jgi:hypothetical protein
MRKYGILKNGNLQIVPSGTSGAKPIIHADVPEFDQETQAVFEKEPVDMGEYIFIDVEVREVDQDDEQRDEDVF